MTEIRVGLQRDIKDANCPVESVAFVDVLEQIKTSQNLKKLTDAVRAADGKDDRDQAKARLPAIIVSANTTLPDVYIYRLSPPISAKIENVKF